MAAAKKQWPTVIQGPRFTNEYKYGIRNHTKEKPYLVSSYFFQIGKANSTPFKVNTSE